MFVPFDSLPDLARVWIYQSDRKLSEMEQRTISDTLQSFINQWTAHNQPLKASFAVLYDYFVVLAVDESYTGASGCSIDSSVAIILQLSDQLTVDFFNRTTVAFYIDETVNQVGMGELKRKHEEGFWRGDTLAFDNTVLTKGAFLSGWMRKANETWLKRYLSKVTV